MPTPLLSEAEQKFSASFESLANKILEEKSQRFTEQNKANIGQILEPLRTKIHEFQAKVEEVYVQEGKDRSALAEQVKQLMGLNQQLSQEASNLTLALKGSSKTQGNWGEMVLERVLEDCGLRKDLDYLMRPTYANLWRQELQKRSVQEIVKRGADLYDKLVGFVEDLKTLGQRLAQARDSYDSAYSKLYSGKGNVIRRAEMLKELGVKPLKTLPAELVEAALEVPALSATSEEEGQNVQGGDG